MLTRPGQGSTLVSLPLIERSEVRAPPRGNERNRPTNSPHTHTAVVAKRELQGTRRAPNYTRRPRSCREARTARNPKGSQLHTQTPQLSRSENCKEPEGFPNFTLRPPYRTKRDPGESMSEGRSPRASVGATRSHQTNPSATTQSGASQHCKEPEKQHPHRCLPVLRPVDHRLPRGLRPGGMKQQRNKSETRRPVDHRLPRGLRPGGMKYTLPRVSGPVPTKTQLLRSKNCKTPEGRHSMDLRRAALVSVMRRAMAPAMRRWTSAASRGFVESNSLSFSEVST